MKIKEVADLTGISVRTLHYYDEIGLLQPEQTTSAGYRIYKEDNLDPLQQILLFREMGLPLSKIKEILRDPAYNRTEVLQMHRQYLLEKRNRIDQMIDTVERTIRYTRGEMTMTNKEKFQGFDFSHNPHEAEARKRWGDQIVDEANRKISMLGTDERQVLSGQYNSIFHKLAAIRHLDPASDEAQAGIGEWYDLLNAMGSYSPEAFRGLGQMYVDDERFTQNIDKFGDGLARFMCYAMACFADRLH
jgi:DNA-binding transcriptional MerR regulator